MVTQRYTIHSSNNSEHTSISAANEAPILNFKRSAVVSQESERPTDNNLSCAGRLSNSYMWGKLETASQKEILTRMYLVTKVQDVGTNILISKHCTNFPHMEKLENTLVMSKSQE